MPTIPPISSRTERFVRFLRKRAWLVVGTTALLAAACGLAATRLELRTDFAELLPDQDPSVKELRRLQTRLPGYAALIVNIHSADRVANLAFADDLGLALAGFKDVALQGQRL